MAQAGNQELTDRFVRFYRNYYHDAVGELAQRYPSEQRSLYVDYNDLYTFDPDLAEDYVTKPEQMQDYAEEALRLYDLPADVKLGQAHVRLRGLSRERTVDIRDIRVQDDHIGSLIAVQGIVRKATDVRPKVTEAAFECQRCGTMTYIPQSDGGFQEPHECQGCERQGPFRVNHDQSEFVDSQKIRVQESPEGLRGGETPQSIDVNLEDDATGQVTAGDHVTVTGVLHIDQVTQGNDKTNVFELYMDGVTVEIEDEEFEDMDITEEDVQEIVELSQQPDLYEQMVGSIAPAIYGYDEEKLAMVLQLFSGVTKHLPDGSRIRGDLHMLLIGDPGTGKCVRGDTRITLGDGRRVPIREFVESHLDDPEPVDDGVWDAVDVTVPSLTPDGKLEPARATKVWKREAPDELYRVRTSGGAELEVTPSHPLFGATNGLPAAKQAAEIDDEEFVAVADDATANTDVVPVNGAELRRIRERLCLSREDCGLARSTYRQYERGDRTPGRESLTAVVDRFEARLDELRAFRDRIEGSDREAVVDARRELGLSRAEVAGQLPGGRTAASDRERTEPAPDGGSTAAVGDDVVDRIDRSLSVAEDVGRLRAAVAADVRWERVESIERVDHDDDWVYDLEVEGTHSYISNGVVSHNSQMLSYVEQVAPRSVYTSGKGSSAAGLTAAAVRDDFGDGQQWTLEAGALVLADKGIAAIDELDKMSCVTGETLVTLSDGRVERIGTLATEAAAGGDVQQLSNGRLVRDPDLDVWTMDGDGRLVERPVSVVHEYDAPARLTEVTLETGESLTATDDHPFFVLDDGSRTEREAAALEPGDWVYVPREVPTPASDGAGVASPADDAVEPRGTDPAMASVLGYLAGDGNVYYNREEGSYGVRFVNGDEELLADFERVAREAFDATPTRPQSERRDDGVETVRVHGKACADAVLDAGANLGRYDQKCFPAAVSDGSRAAKAGFVRALADSDGSVDTEAGRVRLFSASRDLLSGTRTLLLQFGITSQLQARESDDGRDVYVLTITDADSLAAFRRYVGFTASRKADALDEVVAQADGDRTMLDVIPDVDALLANARESLRLRQSECGLNPETYRSFENGEANVSLHRAQRILDAFESRRERADDDRAAVEAGSWEMLADLKERYHVSQSELARGTEWTQPQISQHWGEDDRLREVVSERLGSLIADVADTELDDLRRLVRGDVKWRRVADVDEVDAERRNGRRRVLRQRLADALGCGADAAPEAASELLAREPAAATGREELDAELRAHGVSRHDLAASLGVDRSTVSRLLSGAAETDRFEAVREAAVAEMRDVRTTVRSLLDRLEAGPKVYDLTVEGTHNFVANGLVVHNSDDRSAMHEGLEQQKISISKAGINATLKSRCSLLGAANPKYGRFDQYEPIGEQIDLEPALISRFDLIFTVTDQPDPEHDSRLADHILTTNYAGELNTQYEELPSSEFTSEEIDDVTEEVAPDVDAELLRKYVAYARRNVYPTMSDEARDAVEEFYVDLRSKGADEDAPVPVTARKLEAMVRLAEASARVRLSDTVDAEDADRAIEITRSCLEDIGVDPETGEFDADVVETGTSKTQRDRIQNIRGLIEDIEAEYEDGAPIEEVLDRADEIGMDPGKAEEEIEKLRRKGEVYEPQQGHLRTT
ncbi:MAG: LAGLIDADG family homing endonuclease [Halolamina sp.]